MSKSGTLTYQMMYELRDFGFSTAVGIGGDPVIGTTHIDCLEAFERDLDADAIVMIGEIGGDAEERAADYIAVNVSKPVVGYVAGFTAPEGRPWATPVPSCRPRQGRPPPSRRPRGRRGEGRQDAQRHRRPYARDHDRPSRQSSRPETAPHGQRALTDQRGGRATDWGQLSKLIWVIRSPARTATVFHCSLVKS